MNFMPLLLSIFTQADGLTLGPFLGHIDHDSAFVWVRAASPGAFVLEAGVKGEELSLRADGVADAEHPINRQQDILLQNRARRGPVDVVGIE